MRLPHRLLVTPTASTTSRSRRRHERCLESVAVPERDLLRSSVDVSYFRNLPGARCRGKPLDSGDAFIYRRKTLRELLEKGK